MRGSARRLHKVGISSDCACRNGSDGPIGTKEKETMPILSGETLRRRVGL
jgi:hypothetical protein